MSINRRYCILIATLLPCCLHAEALGSHVATDTITGKVHSISEVVVSGNASRSKVTSTVLSQSISGKELSNLGIQNMADAVRRFAGVNVKDYGGIGGLKTVSVRNIGAAHTAVSYDGVAVSNCQAGQIDIGRFSLDNVANLSLAIGQSDDILQSARHYASAAVVSIETERPHFDEGQSHLSRVKIGGGSFGYVSPSIRHWQKIGNHTSVSLDANFMHADGDYPFTLVNGKNVTKEHRINSFIRSWRGEANLFHTLSRGGDLNWKAYYFNSVRGLPGAVIYYNPTSKERLWDENFFTQLRFRKRLSDEWSLLAQAKYNYSRNKYKDTDVKYTDGTSIDINRQYEYYASGAVSYSPIDGLSLAFSQDFAVNSLRSYFSFSSSSIGYPDPLRFTSLSALNVQYRHGGLKLAGQVVGTFVTEDVKNGPVPDDKRRLAPSLSVSYQPISEQQLYVRAMYKSTFRVPTFNDLYYQHIGNTGLRPEKANEFTAGLAWTMTPKSATFGAVTLTADGYYNKVDDKIVAMPSTYVWKMLNYGKVDMWGIDLTASASASVAKCLNLVFAGNYSWQRAVDKTDKEKVTYNGQLPYTPRHNGSVSLKAENPWVNVGYSVTCVSMRYYMAQNIKANEIDGYADHTLSAWKELALGGCSLKLQGEITNLTNEHYDIIKFYPMAGRAWRLTASVTF